jgi:hypothetical protein
MNMREAAAQLYRTAVSTQIREVAWVIPTVQSIHIVAIALVLGSAIVTDLRLAGVLATDETPRTVVRRHLPWMWGALLVLLATGIIMTVGEPNRVLMNNVFWLKMSLVLFAFVLTLLFRLPILNPEFRIEHGRWAKMVKPMAWASLLIWIAVVYCGRWIAYAI